MSSEEGSGLRVSVLMPTFEQAAFLGRSVGSLQAQQVDDWELVMVDDGSADDTEDAVAPFLGDPRVRYLRLPQNQGLGAALNVALDAARAPAVAYLPSDDVWYPDHLADLLTCLSPGVVLAYSGVRHHGGQEAAGAPPGFSLQLVQVVHRRTGDRWVERDEVETDDLDRLYWDALRRRGRAVGTGRVTCEWVEHPGQRSKAMRESCDGGLNVFRSRYRVRTPLRFHSTDSSPVDEVALYARFRTRLPAPPAADGLRILLVGELAFNPERVLALEERGHRLFGLWTRDGLGGQTVGPLPFGHVEDLDGPDWRDAVRQVRPDVVYALLNWRAVPLAHAVLEAGFGIPLVWHFKESPQRCVTRGTWPRLADLSARADAVVLASPEERDWFHTALPGRLEPARALALDGDLPKADWLHAEPSPPLSAADGQVHTVVLGRPIGMDAHVIGRLAAAGVHTHLYGQVRGPGPTGEWQRWLADAQRAAPGRLHVHPHVGQDRWVAELSRYDAGWLHLVHSANGGDLRRATWDDLNLPARIPPLVAAGLPVIQPRSPGCIVAAERLVERLGVGLLYQDLDDLVSQLGDARAMAERRRAAWARRHELTFDHHADRLVEVFRAVVDGRR